MDWQQRVIVNPDICHGKPCIKGTRVLVSVLLDNLATGLSPQEIAASYPSITPEDVLAAVGYAADATRERVVALSA